MTQTPRDRVAAYRAFLDGGCVGDPPEKPSLEDIASLPWPAREILSRQWLGVGIQSTAYSDDDAHTYRPLPGG